MTKTNFALSAASLFLAAACGGSAPAESTTPATTTPAASEGGATDMDQASHTEATAGQVKCVGINECKGQGACHMPSGHACAGQNECKGKGWVLASADDCSTKGGTTLAE